MSLTALDQTPFAALDENSAFNFFGRRKLAEVIGQSNQGRANIQTGSVVAAGRAKATKAKEAVITARQVAEARKDAAQDRAQARREEARTEADAITIRAEAKKKDMLAEAEGKRATTDAENALSEGIIAMKFALARLEPMPAILAETMTPVERIDSIRVHDISGLGQGSGGFASGANADKPPVNQALDSIMGMAVRMPALRKLGEDLVLSMDGTITGLVNGALGDLPQAGGDGGEHAGGDAPPA